MKFGFDIDGTISAAPGPFAAIMAALRNAGHEVHVITGQTIDVTDADRDRRIEQLKALGISHWLYDELHIAGPPDWIADKAEYCATQGICLMFEDSHEYAAAIVRSCPVTVMFPGSATVYPVA